MTRYIRNSLFIPWYYYAAAIALFLILRKWTGKKTVSILLPYMFLVYATTVLNRTASETANYNLTLFYRMSRETVRQMMANAVMFMPIGFLLPASMWQKKSAPVTDRQPAAAPETAHQTARETAPETALATAPRTIPWYFSLLAIVCGCLFSFAVEGSQLYLHKGLCEANDLFSNSVGVVLGYVLYRIADRYGITSWKL